MLDTPLGRIAGLIEEASTDAGTPPRRRTRADPSAASASSWTSPSRDIWTTRAPGTTSIWAACSAESGAPKIGVARMTISSLR